VQEIYWEWESGFINEIGFDTYQKLNEAIEELKENEFKDLYPLRNDIETKEYVKDQIDTDFELLFLTNTSIMLLND
jgi:transcription-repair coupling factor (superfamily II helicase)